MKKRPKLFKTGSVMAAFEKALKGKVQIYKDSPFILANEKKKRPAT